MCSCGGCAVVHRHNTMICNVATHHLVQSKRIFPSNGACAWSSVYLQFAHCLLMPKHQIWSKEVLPQFHRCGVGCWIVHNFHTYKFAPCNALSHPNKKQLTSLYPRDVYSSFKVWSLNRKIFSSVVYFLSKRLFRSWLPVRNSSGNMGRARHPFHSPVRQDNW